MKQFLLTFITAFLSVFSSPYFTIALIAIITVSTITAVTLTHAIIDATLVILLGLVLYKDTVIEQ